MKKFFILSVVMVLVVFAKAQKNGGVFSAPYNKQTCRAIFDKMKYDTNEGEKSIEEVLINLLPALKSQDVALKLNYINTSPGGIHYSFTQLYKGVPVYQSEIKVNANHYGIIQSVFDNSYDTKFWNLSVENADANTVIAINPEDGFAVVAQVNIVAHHLETLTANGKIIFQRDLNSYYQPADSTVSGKVFNPDPLTTSQHVYTDIASVNGTDTLHYDNNNTADAPWMDAQQQIVNFKAMFDGQTFSLASPYVVLSTFGDTAAPNVAPATSVNGQFYFNRAQTGFQDVNAYYHISTHRNYVSSLGFNCADSLVEVNTHALFADNSYFSPTDYPRRIYYGIGGVPDAEDADVVVHEYSHSLSYNCAPNSNVGLERNSLDEAFADYNAGAYSKALSLFNDEWVYNWDGHNQYWPGRILNSTDVYPGALSGNIYTNGQMWSAVLFALNQDIDRTVTDSLIYQAHYSYAQNMSMAQAAVLLLQADTLLFNGAHYCYIYNRLLQHGFVSQVNNGCWPVGVAKVDEQLNITFQQTGNAFTVYSDGLSALSIKLYAVTGQLVAAPINIEQSVFNYQNPELASGIYLINVTTTHGAATFKWVNAKR